MKHSARMEGFVVHDVADRNDEAIEKLGGWIENGTLQHRENIAEGLENAPQAFIDLFSSKGFGKQLVKLAEDVE